MTGSFSNGLRRIATLCLLASLAAPATGANFAWVDADHGFWGTPGNWLPAGPPGLADTALIGNLPGIANHSVQLNFNDAVQRVEVTDGMTFSTNGNTFSTIGDTYLSGYNIVPFEGGGGETHHHSRIYVEPSAGFVEYSTDDLVVSDEARVQLHNGGTLEVRGWMDVNDESDLYGTGEVRFQDSGDVLSLDGVIRPRSGGIVMNVLNGGLLDLDGLTGGGRLHLEWENYHLTINGGALADSFSGEIIIDGDSTLAMNLDSDWTADAGSEIFFGRNNNGISPGAAVLAGSAAATLGGLVEAPYGVHGRVDAEAVYAPTANVLVNQTALLEMNNATLIEGGQFVLEEDADLRFDGAVDVRGGQFTTHSKLSADGAVRFNGPTTWRGDATVNGVALQNGDATVSGLTTIHAGVFDMDGGGNTEWDINHYFSLTTESVDSTISNKFDGVINVGALFGNLSVQLTGSFDEWTMNGELNLTNNLPGAAERVDGDRMRMSGELNTDGLVRIAADVEFASGGVTTFADAAAELRMESETFVESGATFLGEGTLVNQSGGVMNLADGATLGPVDLVNHGLLEVGDSPGVASADAFENGAGATWLVEIGGHVAGVEHDWLQITGAALLDGVMEVDLIDAGAGLFLPAIGDEFTVLTAVGDVSGAFLADPVSHAAGQAYHWEVLYHPHDVTLRLVDITSTVPEPTTAVLALLGLGGFAARRR